MVYLIGIAGLVFGFIFGQMVLYVLLRHKPAAELLQDPSLKWKFGTLNWIIAIGGAYSFVAIYAKYFMTP